MKNGENDKPCIILLRLYISPFKKKKERQQNKKVNYDYNQFFE